MPLDIHQLRYIINLRLITVLILSLALIGCSAFGCQKDPKKTPANNSKAPISKPEPTEDVDTNIDDNDEDNTTTSPQRPETPGNTSPPGDDNIDIDRPNNLYVSNYNYSIKIDAKERSLKKADIIWIIDNSDRNVYMGYNSKLSNLVRDFIANNASEDINVTVITAQNPHPPACEPYPIKRDKIKEFKRGQGFGVRLNPQEFLNKIDCEVDNFNTINILAKFLSGSTAYDGIDSSNVLRQLSYKAAVLTSPSIPLGLHADELKTAIKDNINHGFFSFFSISAADPIKNRPVSIRRGLYLAPPYQNYFESNIYLAKCGNSHSQTYENLTKEFLGKSFRICDFNPANVINQIMKTIKSQQSTIIPLDELENEYFQIIKVYLDGKILPEDSYQVFQGPSMPFLKFQNPQDLESTKEIEIIFAAAFVYE